jgi:hypothetical protein
MASKGKIHTVFQTNLQDIAAQDGKQADMIRGKGDRPWNRPKLAPDPLDIAGITNAYNRQEVDANYAELLKVGSDPGTCGDVICVKTQGDYIAEMERGFRARHATPVRCIGHALARRRGHANDAGVFLGGVLKHVQDALKSGQSIPAAAVAGAAAAAVVG